MANFFKGRQRFHVINKVGVIRHLERYWLGGRKGIRPVNTVVGVGVVVCLEQGADNSMIYI